jgi:ribosomal protein L31E
MILIQDEDVNTAIFKEGVDKNRKSLEVRIDEGSGK